MFETLKLRVGFTVGVSNKGFLLFCYRCDHLQLGFIVVENLA